MKIFVTGTRGIPDIPGGVETHCQHLYPLIVELGHEVRLARRDAYVEAPLDVWKGVELVDLHSPRKKSLEAIVHTFLAILEARRWGADLVHIHAIGPGLLVPFARVLGLKVVITNHGPDYNRQKWGFVARSLLKLGEFLGGKFANEVIVISRHIGGIVRRRCGRDSTLIPNGVHMPQLASSQGYINELGLTPGKYMIAVARFVPEKGLHDLLEAFSSIDTDWQLVLAGDADYEDDYSRSLKARAKQLPGVILTGYITGEPLNELITHAGLFVMPSYHEGLPIALLEAMIYGLPVLVSDIPANVEVGLEEGDYTVCGDVDELSQGIIRKIHEKRSDVDRQKTIEQVRERYSWRDIAHKTVGVYKGILSE
jgi:glycosyltransferase involved in cell wall biosynthesis